MPQVVAQGHGLGQVLIQPQCPGDGPGDLAHLKGVGQPGAVMIPLRGEEHLGFLLQAAKRLAVQNAVPVPLILGAQRAGLLRPPPAPAVRLMGRPRGQNAFFDAQSLFPDGHAALPPLIYNKVKQKLPL